MLTLKYIGDKTDLPNLDILPTMMHHAQNSDETPQSDNRSQLKPPLPEGTKRGSCYEIHGRKTSQGKHPSIIKCAIKREGQRHCAQHTSASPKRHKAFGFWDTEERFALFFLNLPQNPKKIRVSKKVPLQM